MVLVSMYDTENENERKTEHIVFCVMMFSLLIASGQFLIDNSNVIRLNNLETYGDVVNAKIISAKSSYDQKAISVTFDVNNREYKRRILLNESEAISNGTISLHYLKAKPEKAVHLKSLKKSYPKYIIGWLLTISAIVFALYSITKFRKRFDKKTS